MVSPEVLQSKQLLLRFSYFPLKPIFIAASFAPFVLDDDFFNKEELSGSFTFQEKLIRHRFSLHSRISGVFLSRS